MLCVVMLSFMSFPLFWSSSLEAGACLANFSVNEKPCNITAGFKEDVFKLQEDSLKKVDLLLKDKEFQEVVSDLKQKLPSAVMPAQASAQQISAELYVFVSFSMSKVALLKLAQEAKRYNATLVFRGFKEGSYKKTVQALNKIIQKTEQGFLVDPEFFTLFNVNSVPTYVLTKSFPVQNAEWNQTPLYDRLQGHVSLHYALEQFAKEGDLKTEASALLEKGRPR